LGRCPPSKEGQETAVGGERSPRVPFKEKKMRIGDAIKKLMGTFSAEKRCAVPRKKNEQFSKGKTPVGRMMPKMGERAYLPRAAGFMDH